MRIEHPGDRWYARVAEGAAILGGLAVGAILHAGSGAIWGGALGFAIALGIARAYARRSTRRLAALAQPFPEAWRQFLETRYDHYDRLPEALRGRFEDDVRIFLADARITGVEIEVTDELRLLVAASAATLSLGWPEYEWEQLTEALIYPDDFDRDYRFGGDERAGETHPWGTIILSAPALEKSFADPDDGYHVGLHEFAHLLDVDQTRFDGVLPGLSEDQRREWVALVEKETERIHRRKSALDPYGEESPVEFLAVAVEAFFEMPLVMRQRHRELYQMLAAYFRQDPAAWDDERGLVL